MSYERSRDLSNGCGPPTRKADAKPCGANVRSSVSIAQTRHSPSGQFRKFKLTHYPVMAGLVLACPGRPSSTRAAVSYTVGSGSANYSGACKPNRVDGR